MVLVLPSEMAAVRASVSVYDPETVKAVDSVPVPAVLTVSLGR